LCVHTPDSQFFRRCASVIREYFWQFPLSASLQAFRRRSGHLTLVGLTTPPVAHVRPCQLDSQGGKRHRPRPASHAREAHLLEFLLNSHFFKRQPGRLETPVTHTKQTAATTFNGQLSGTSRLQFSSAQGLGRSHAMSDFQYFNCDLSTSLVFQFRLSNFPLLLRWRHD
jgi:hypothetical protein